MDAPTQAGHLVEPVIQTSELVKVYREGGTRAVDGLNLEIRKGEVYALIGANGSGKTTLINMLTGSLYPTSGSIRVLGCDMPAARRTVAAQTGVAPQEYALHNDLTVEQNIFFFARLYGVRREASEKRLGALLQILRLEKKRKVR